MDWTSGLIMYGVLALVVGFGIANTFLMAFMERTREYGVLLSLGMRPVKLSLMTYIESIMLMVAGLLAGLAMSVPLTLYYARRGIRFPGEDEIYAQYGIDPVIHPLMNVNAVLWAVGIVAVITALMAVYPAAKASRLKPVEAMGR